ncbi:MAG TPA: alternative ribosome rescue aminoacyl-tRNA hydrolase ArfB [Devosiaceae bacterium]|jgi:ribosome-associated protein
MPERLPIADGISLDAGEIALSFIRSSGPGGQNVNKVSSAVQLRFDLKNSPSLPDGLKRRAAALAGSRLTADGVIVLTASGSRSQPQNREEAIARLIELLQAAAPAPKHRRATRPTLGSRTRRLAAKTRRGAIKTLRAGKPPVE